MVQYFEMSKTREREKEELELTTPHSCVYDMCWTIVCFVELWLLTHLKMSSIALVALIAEELR